MTGPIPDETNHLFQLKTLYDVSRDLFEAKDDDTVLQKSLQTISGALGVVEGFVVLLDVPSGDISHAAARGIHEQVQESMRRSCADFLKKEPSQNPNGSRFEANTGRFPECFQSVIPFSLDKSCRGVLALGDKITQEPFTPQDVDLLLTLTNHLMAALRNSRFVKQMESLNQDLQRKNLALETTFAELDRRIYHLKTLNDVSRDIFSTVEFDTILNHFLLMIMGNFGVMQGFAAVVTGEPQDISFFKAMGYDSQAIETLKTGALQIIGQVNRTEELDPSSILENPGALAPHDICGVPFRVADTCHGFLGMGSKIIGEPFSDDDRELMTTLVNSLVVSLQNALSFKHIKQLNRDLQDKNLQLEKTLEELKAALRKVELLESIKSNLSKFVPTAVTRLVENATTSEIHEAQEQDISVLFLDIEGYTKITDEIGATNVNTLIERYFSVFMDAIYANDGDVVETAGDGLMVLFLSADRTENALQAVRSAQTIMEKACSINDACTMESQRCLVNVGVSSGRAFVGAAKFDSIIGSRWTYTTHGTIVNIAARLCGKAKGGEALVSAETVRRVQESFQFKPLGKFSLKNLAEAVEVFALE